MATENVVQVPPNSSGLKVRTVELTRADGAVVELQVVVGGDPTNIAALETVLPGSDGGKVTHDKTTHELLLLILLELQELNANLAGAPATALQGS